MAERRIQLAKNFKELKGKKLDAVFQYGGFVSQKLDGVWVGVYVSGGSAQFLSSSNEPMLSMNGTTAAEEFSRLPDGVYIGELYSDSLPQKDISGISRKQVEGAGAELKVGLHDLITFDDYWAGKAEAPFSTRLKRLQQYVYPVDTFHTYKNLWILPQTEFQSPDAAKNGFQEMASDIAKHNGEGAIFKPRFAGWEVGERGFNVIRIKATLTYDLEVIGVTDVGRTDKGGLTGGIKVRWREFGMGRAPEVEQIVRGMSHAELEAWAEDPSLIIGKIVEVEAMNITPLGILREPRFKSVRLDKHVPDL